MSGDRTHLGSLSADVAAYDMTAVASPGNPLADRSQFVRVTSAAGTDILVLPEPKLGRTVYFESGANGVSLQAKDPVNQAINGGTGASAVSAIPANTLVRLICSTFDDQSNPQTATWIGTNFDSAGAVTATAAAA